MATTSQTLALAIQHHQGGRLEAAEQIYRQVLRAEPNNAEALHLLGVVAHQRGKHDVAVETIGRAIELQGDAAYFHGNLGAVYHALQRFPEAVACYRRALKLKPQYADAHNNLGNALKDQGKLDDAVACFHEALKLRPDYAEARNNLGNALKDQEKLEEAVASYRKAVELKPDYADAYNNLGNVLKYQGKPDEAVASYRRAVELKPDYAGAYNNLAIVLMAQRAHGTPGRPDEAIAAYRKAVELQPDYVEAHNNLAVALMGCGELDEAVAGFRRALELKADYAEAHNNLGVALKDQENPDEAAAIACFRRAVELKPDYAAAYNNLGVALKDQGKLDEAVASFRRALELKPDYAEAHNNLGIATKDQGKPEEAVPCFRRAVELKPDYADANLNCALSWLLSGNFAEGWPEYEWRWRKKNCPPRGFSQTPWDGGPLQEKTILLYAEQGFGDTFQFIRYVPWIRQRHTRARVLVECQKPLVRLLAASFSGKQGPGIDRLIGEGEALPEFDVHAPLMGLPLLCGTRLENVPADVPYLHAAPELVAQWRDRLSQFHGFKIGICWQGNAQYHGDRFRSIPLRHFAALAEIPGICWIGLQKAAGRKQLAEVRHDFPVVDLADELDREAGAFADTAAVMKNLDLVISSDTAIVHLAGAMGVPVWVALARVPDWRWLLHRSDSPWYPTMRIFRQKGMGDWTGVFAEMGIALREQLEH